VSCCATRTARVTGVVARRQAITATRGVVLAAGGFPQDAVRRKELFPRTPTAPSTGRSPP
jgi:hypothetical protein